MIRILFLLLVVMSSIAFAQTEKKPEAIKFAEFAAATNDFVKKKIEAFYIELENKPNSQGYIINYGTDKQIALREQQIRQSITFLKYDSPRVTIVRGGFWKNIKTEFWIVPPGAENPMPTSTAEKFDEFEKILYEDTMARIENLYVNLGNNPNLHGYILNFGSAKVVAAR